MTPKQQLYRTEGVKIQNNNISAIWKVSEIIITAHTSFRNEQPYAGFK